MVGGPGIQINAVVGRACGAAGAVNREGTYCDHHCTSEGNYVCPVARDYVELTSLAPARYLACGIKNAAQALRQSRDIFLQYSFDDYAVDSCIPQEHAGVFKQLLWASGKKVDVNLFGGEAGWHPGVCEVVSELKKEQGGFTVILTTTGSPLIKNKKLGERILSSQLDLIALSADGLSAERIHELCAMDLEGIRREWSTIPSCSQEKKAYEAIHAAKVAKGRVSVMFNVVVHPGNIGEIMKILDALDQHFPLAKKNPYFAQSSFYHGDAVFAKEHEALLEKFSDSMINEQLKQVGQSKKFVPRLHYWLLQKAAFETFSGQELRLALSGYGLWKCYAAGRANAYLQIGKSGKASDSGVFGGHLGCFWNDETVTLDDKQVWSMSNEEIHEYLSNQHVLAQAAAKPCPGCSMPRLIGNAVSMELGMNPALKTKYLQLRKKHVGF